MSARVLPWQNAVFRNVHTLSWLAPDYYSFFPVFTDYELLFRLDALGPISASLLNQKNVRRLVELCPGTRGDFLSFVQSPFEQQRESVCSILRRLGFGEFAIQGIGATPREVFMPEAFRQFAYLDLSLPVTQFCWISPWSIVALYLEFSEPHCLDGVLPVEIGLGTGYHAVALSNATGKSMVGYEIDENAREIAARVIGLLNRPIEILSEAPAIDVISSWSNRFIYFTCNVDSNSWDSLGRRMISSSVALGPTSITSEEFEKTKDSDYFKKYRSYSEYSRDEPRFLRIALWKSGVEKSLLYDLKFVPFVNGSTLPQPGTSDPPESALWLRDTLR